MNFWLSFGDWSGEGMGTAEQVARDYGVEYARMEGEAGVVAVWDGATEPRWRCLPSAVRTPVRPTADGDGEPLRSVRHGLERGAATRLVSGGALHAAASPRSPSRTIWCCHDSQR